MYVCMYEHIYTFIYVFTRPFKYIYACIYIGLLIVCMYVYHGFFKVPMNPLTIIVDHLYVQYVVT